MFNNIIIGLQAVLKVSYYLFFIPFGTLFITLLFNYIVYRMTNKKINLIKIVYHFSLYAKNKVLNYFF